MFFLMNGEQSVKNCTGSGFDRYVIITQREKAYGAFKTYLMEELGNAIKKVLLAQPCRRTVPLLMVKFGYSHNGGRLR
jgi:hypothetical protein